MNKRSYKQKIILTGSLFGVLGFLPFTIYYYTTDDYAAALIEFYLAVAILSIFMYVWLTHRIKMMGVVLTVLFMGAACTMVYLKGPELIYWMYPASLGAFLSIHHRDASIANLLLAILTFPAIYTQFPTMEVLRIYTTLTMLSAFGYTFAIMTQKQRLQLSQLVERDALTGALNRRSLDKNMLIMINRKQQQPDWSASLIILDVDHFKDINDNYGHSSGDQILTRITQLIQSRIRASDQFYRYGGEEFVIIADNTSSKEAAAIAENIRKCVENSKLFEKRNITISLGVAELKPQFNASQWLSLADKALYEAKRQGRNRACVAKKGKLSIAA
ncbi:MAG: hypothetical protein CSB47_10075 [Proteobacteria bacterium]|nr:MAG: hypothetical protein CSB47_10075 [Pseudomonadota bacterium]